ncbi:MAG: hypothetical protein N2652_09500 [Kiritimatiellae bacterium]|nr:hypothetical protein [Kiritimatiellia bacterium]
MTRRKAERVRRAGAAGRCGDRAGALDSLALRVWGIAWIRPQLFERAMQAIRHTPATIAQRRGELSHCRCAATPAARHASRLGPVALLAGTLLECAAEPVRNGNDFALEWSQQTNTTQRARLLAAHTNRLHTFRHLRVERIEPAGAAVRLCAREPASGAAFELVVESRQSLDLARSLAPGEAIAARGRLHWSPRREEFLLQPALLDFRDRSSPKAGKELLREVDPKAR